MNEFMTTTTLMKGESLSRYELGNFRIGTNGEGQAVVDFAVAPPLLLGGKRLLGSPTPPYRRPKLHCPAVVKLAEGSSAVQKLWHWTIDVASRTNILSRNTCEYPEYLDS